MINCNILLRYGRDYYINDTERTNGTPKNKRNSGSYLASKAILNSSDEDRVSDDLYDEFSKFGKPLHGTSTRVRRSTSLNSLRHLSHKRSSLNTNYSSDNASTYSTHSLRIPKPKINKLSESSVSLNQYEEQLLHSNFRRNSFRVKNNSTKNFVTNPLYDESIEISNIDEHQSNNTNT